MEKKVNFTKERFCHFFRRSTLGSKVKEVKALNTCSPKNPQQNLRKILIQVRKVERKKAKPKWKIMTKLSEDKQEKHSKRLKETSLNF